jgi:hypothetical protein
MEELEELKLKIFYLEDEIQRLQLRLENAVSFVEFVLKTKEREKQDADNT